jgi:hypothetical protein
VAASSSIRVSPLSVALASADAAAQQAEQQQNSAVNNVNNAAIVAASSPSDPRLAAVADSNPNPSAAHAAASSEQAPQSGNVSKFSTLNSISAVNPTATASLTGCLQHAKLLFAKAVQKNFSSSQLIDYDCSLDLPTFLKLQLELSLTSPREVFSQLKQLEYSHDWINKSRLKSVARQANSCLSLILQDLQITLQALLQHLFPAPSVTSPSADSNKHISNELIPRLMESELHWLSNSNNQQFKQFLEKFTQLDGKSRVKFIVAKSTPSSLKGAGAGVTKPAEQGLSIEAVSRGEMKLNKLEENKEKLTLIESSARLNAEMLVNIAETEEKVVFHELELKKLSDHKQDFELAVKALAKQGNQTLQQLETQGSLADSTNAAAKSKYTSAAFDVGAAGNPLYISLEHNDPALCLSTLLQKCLSELGGGNVKARLENWPEALLAEKSYAAACIKHNNLAEQAVKYSSSIQIIELLRQILFGSTKVRCLNHPNTPAWLRNIVQSVFRDVRAPLLNYLRDLEELEDQEETLSTQSNEEEEGNSQVVSEVKNSENGENKIEDNSIEGGEFVDRVLVGESREDYLNRKMGHYQAQLKAKQKDLNVKQQELLIAQRIFSKSNQAKQSKMDQLFNTAKQFVENVHKNSLFLLSDLDEIQSHTSQLNTAESPLWPNASNNKRRRHSLITISPIVSNIMQENEENSASEDEKDSLPSLNRSFTDLSPNPYHSSSLDSSYSNSVKNRLSSGSLWSSWLSLEDESKSSDVFEWSTAYDSSWICNLVRGEQASNDLKLNLKPSIHRFHSISILRYTLLSTFNDLFSRGSGDVLVDTCIPELVLSLNRLRNESHIIHHSKLIIKTEQTQRSLSTFYKHLASNILQQVSTTSSDVLLYSNPSWHRVKNSLALFNLDFHRCDTEILASSGIFQVIHKAMRSIQGNISNSIQAKLSKQNELNGSFDSSRFARLSSHVMFSPSYHLKFLLWQTYKYLALFSLDKLHSAGCEAECKPLPLTTPVLGSRQTSMAEIQSNLVLPTVTNQLFKLLLENLERLNNLPSQLPLFSQDGVLIQAQEQAKLLLNCATLKSLCNQQQLIQLIQLNTSAVPAPISTIIIKLLGYELNRIHPKDLLSTQMSNVHTPQSILTTLFNCLGAELSKFTALSPLRQVSKLINPKRSPTNKPLENKESATNELSSPPPINSRSMSAGQTNGSTSSKARGNSNNGIGASVSSSQRGWENPPQQDWQQLNHLQVNPTSIQLIEELILLFRSLLRQKNWRRIVLATVMKPLQELSSTVQSIIQSAENAEDLVSARYMNSCFSSLAICGGWKFNIRKGAFVKHTIIQNRIIQATQESLDNSIMAMDCVYGFISEYQPANYNKVAYLALNSSQSKFRPKPYSTISPATDPIEFNNIPVHVDSLTVEPLISPPLLSNEKQFSTLWATIQSTLQSAINFNDKHAESKTQSNRLNLCSLFLQQLQSHLINFLTTQIDLSSRYCKRIAMDKSSQNITPLRSSYSFDSPIFPGTFSASPGTSTPSLGTTMTIPLFSLNDVSLDMIPSAPANLLPSQPPIHSRSVSTPNHCAANNIRNNIPAIITKGNSMLQSSASLPFSCVDFTQFLPLLLELSNSTKRFLTYHLPLTIPEHDLDRYNFLFSNRLINLINAEESRKAQMQQITRKLNKYQINNIPSSKLTRNISAELMTAANSAYPAVQSPIYEQSIVDSLISSAANNTNQLVGPVNPANSSVSESMLARVQSAVSSLARISSNSASDDLVSQAARSLLESISSAGNLSMANPIAVEIQLPSESDRNGNSVQQSFHVLFAGDRNSNNAQSVSNSSASNTNSSAPNNRDNPSSLLRWEDAEVSSIPHYEGEEESEEHEESSSSLDDEAEYNELEYDEISSNSGDELGLDIHNSLLNPAQSSSSSSNPLQSNQSSSSVSLLQFVRQLTEMGFNIDLARVALSRTGGNLQDAIELLVSGVLQRDHIDENTGNNAWQQLVQRLNFNEDGSSVAAINNSSSSAVIAGVDASNSSTVLLKSRFFRTTTSAERSLLISGVEELCSAQSRDLNNLSIGNFVDGRDSYGDWYLAQIIKLKGDNPKVYLLHFFAWDSQYDEWIQSNSERIRAASLFDRTKQRLESDRFIRKVKIYGPAIIELMKKEKEKLKEKVNNKEKQAASIQLIDEFSYSALQNKEIRLESFDNSNPNNYILGSRVLITSTLVEWLNNNVMIRGLLDLSCDWSVGDRLYVLDTVNKVCECEIIDMRGNSELKIHYIGWNSKWDEWLNVNSPRLQSNKKGSYQLLGNKRSKILHWYSLGATAQQLIRLINRTGIITRIMKINKPSMVSEKKEAESETLAEVELFDDELGSYITFWCRVSILKKLKFCANDVPIFNDYTLLNLDRNNLTQTAANWQSVLLNKKITQTIQTINQTAKSMQQLNESSHLSKHFQSCLSVLCSASNDYSVLPATFSSHRVGVGYTGLNELTLGNAHFSSFYAHNQNRFSQLAALSFLPPANHQSKHSATNCTERQQAESLAHIQWFKQHLGDRHIPNLSYHNNQSLILSDLLASVEAQSNPLSFLRSQYELLQANLTSSIKLNHSNRVNMKVLKQGETQELSIADSTVDSLLVSFIRSSQPNYEIHFFQQPPPHKPANIISNDNSNSSINNSNSSSPAVHSASHGLLTTAHVDSQANLAAQFHPIQLHANTEANNTLNNHTNSGNINNNSSTADSAAPIAIPNLIKPCSSSNPLLIIRSMPPLKSSANPIILPNPVYIHTGPLINSNKAEDIENEASDDELHITITPFNKTVTKSFIFFAQIVLQYKRKLSDSDPRQLECWLLLVEIYETLKAYMVELHANTCFWPNNEKSLLFECLSHLIFEIIPNSHSKVEKSNYEAMNMNWLLPVLAEGSERYLTEKENWPLYSSYMYRLVELLLMALKAEQILMKLNPKPCLTISTHTLQVNNELDMLSPIDTSIQTAEVLSPVASAIEHKLEEAKSQRNSPKNERKSAAESKENKNEERSESESTTAYSLRATVEQEFPSLLSLLDNFINQYKELLSIHDEVNAECICSVCELLKGKNSEFESGMLLIDFNSPLWGVVFGVSSLLFLPSSYRSRMFTEILNSTATPDRNMPEFIFQTHKEKVLENNTSSSSNDTNASENSDLSVWEQLCSSLGQCSVANLRGRLGDVSWKARFGGLHNRGAEGLPGPFRQSITELCAELRKTNVDKSLLIPCPNAIHDTGLNRNQLIINPNPAINIDEFYRFGQLLGVAIRSQAVLDIDIVDLFWQGLLGYELNESYLANFDYTASRQIQFVDFMDNIELNEEQFNEIYNDLTWTAVLSDSKTKVDLIKNGAQKSVEYKTRYNYSALLSKTRLNESSLQLSYIRSGLYSIVPQASLSLLTAQELENRVCGSIKLDLQLLKRHTVIAPKNFDDSSEIIEHFWSVLSEFSDEDQAKFLQFAWARNRLPPQTGKENNWRMKLNILEAANQQDLVTSETCFFNVNMPNYSSKELLRDKLHLAITHCSSINS